MVLYVAEDNLNVNAGFITMQELVGKKDIFNVS